MVTKENVIHGTEAVAGVTAVAGAGVGIGEYIHNHQIGKNENVLNYLGKMIQDTGAGIKDVVDYLATNSEGHDILGAAVGTLVGIGGITTAAIIDRKKNGPADMSEDFTGHDAAKVGIAVAGTAALAGVGYEGVEAVRVIGNAAADAAVKDKGQGAIEHIKGFFAHIGGDFSHAFNELLTSTGGHDIIAAALAGALGIGAVVGVNKLRNKGTEGNASQMAENFVQSNAGNVYSSNIAAANNTEVAGHAGRIALERAEKAAAEQQLTPAGKTI